MFIGRAKWIGIALCVSGMVARAGTVITTNLPAGDAIINISGTADGAATFDSTQDKWFGPFNTSGQLLEYTFKPGTYTFRLIDQSTAASMFPSLAPAQISQISLGAWSYNVPWVTDWMAWDSSAAMNKTEAQLLSGGTNQMAGSEPGGSSGGFDNAADAYKGAILAGVFNKIITGGGRYTGTVHGSYTFSSTQTLIFGVPDYFLPDNSGSVSVLVGPGGPTVGPPSVPLPRGAWTGVSVLSALILLGLLKSRIRYSY